MWLFWRLARPRIPHLRQVNCGFSDLGNPQNSLHYTIFMRVGRGSNNKMVLSGANPITPFLYIIYVYPYLINFSNSHHTRWIGRPITL